MISSLYLTSTSTRPPLRIGVLTDGMTLARVLRAVLEDIQKSNFATIELVVMNQQPRAEPNVPKGRLVRYLRLLADPARRRNLLYAAYQKADQRHIAPLDPLEPVDCADILAAKPRLDVVPITKGFVHRFPEEALQAIAACKLDVLLRFGFNILRGSVLSAAKYGIWSFHHGDNDFYRGGPALFWELVEESPLSGVILQVLTEKLDDGIVLCKSIFATEAGLWRSRNVVNPYWGSRHFVIRKLHELHESGWDAVQRKIVPQAPYLGKRPIYRAPTNSEVAAWLGPKIGKKLLSRLNPFRTEKLLHWRVALSKAESPRRLTSAIEKSGGHRWVSCPLGHFYADPILIRHNSQHWLFVEDYLYHEQRGTIQCFPVEPDLSVGSPEPCLDLSYHVSYPFVFEHGGEFFMIPESVENETVQLWRATGFPSRWKLEKTLFKGPLVDTTPFYWNGFWYFFTTYSEPRGNGAFAALFTADSLTAEWKLHPASPISTDVRSARSAGPIHRVGGRLFRPVQDCGERYGRRIHVHEILELNPDSFSEHRIGSIEPDWELGLEGVHTYGYCDGIEVLDAVASMNRRTVAPAALKK